MWNSYTSVIPNAATLARGKSRIKGEKNKSRLKAKKVEIELKQLQNNEIPMA